MKILIVDDEKRIRTTLLNTLRIHFPSANVVAEAENIIEASEAIRKYSPDVVLLDIKMPMGSGFELLERMSPVNFKVIFITAFDEFALQAIKFSALDYLLKPVIPEELVDALKKAEQEIENEHIAEKFRTLITNLGIENKETRKIVLNSHQNLYVVNVKEIIRCEADRNYTMFYFIEKRSILVSKSLKEYDEMLSPIGFFRPHHSHLINLSFVERIDKRDGGVLVMKDKSIVPISSKRQSEIIAALLRI